MQQAIDHRQRTAEVGMDVAGKSVYFVGIGGCGMQGLARLFKTRGAQVSGSDTKPTAVTDHLIRSGIPVDFGQATERIPDICDLVVSSAAIKPEHPQLKAAAKRGTPVQIYAQALGMAMVGTTGIAVAGTHGKSTTTAMLGCALAEAGLEPTVIVGATCPRLGGGFRLGKPTIAGGSWSGRPGIVVAEACEFNRSFHNLRPTMACITSVEADHLEIYGSLDAVVESFHTFARLIPPADQDGLLLIADADAHKREVTKGLSCRVETLGFSPGADWQVVFDPGTRRTGLVRRGQGLFAAWQTQMPGAHNALNSGMACVLAINAGADPDRVAGALSDFDGLQRRSQILGDRVIAGGGTVRVYDDYGHHPTEIDVTLKAIRDRERPQDRGGRLICVFQPHQHSRTRYLLDEFSTAFSSADVVIVPDIYFVRDSEQERQLVSAADLVDRLRKRSVQAMHLYPFEAIVEQLEVLCRAGDVVVVMGAGNVDAIGKAFLGGRSSGMTLGGPVTDRT